MIKLFREKSVGLLKPIIRVVFALFLLSVIRFFVISLPMFQELLIPGFPVSMTLILDIAISAFMILILLRFWREFGEQLRTRFPASPTLMKILTSLVYILIVIIAYNATQPVASVVLTPDYVWVYSAVFLLILLIPLYTFSATLYRDIDKIVRVDSSRKAKPRKGFIGCPKCGEVNLRTSKFCTHCGSSLEPAKEKERVEPLRSP